MADLTNDTTGKREQSGKNAVYLVGFAVVVAIATLVATIAGGSASDTTAGGLPWAGGAGKRSGKVVRHLTYRQTRTSTCY